METIKWNELYFNDVESGLKYIKDTCKSDEYSLIIDDEEISNKLEKLLIENRIEFRFKREKENFKYFFNFEHTYELKLAVYGKMFNNSLYGKITKIDIRYLFGYLRYNLKMEDDLIVVHAPNGYGKSTFIKCVDYFYSNDFNSLFKLPFYTFDINFLDSDSNYDREKPTYFSFINDTNKYVYFNENNYEKFFFKYVPSNPDYEYIENRINSHLVIHNLDNLEKYNECKVRSAGNKFIPGGFGNRDLFEKTIDLFNDMVSNFFEDEKIVYLEKKYKERDGGIYFNFRESLVIKNNVEPFKEFNNIFKRGDLIPFDKLSSGEQYILYLLYMLISYNELGLNNTYLFIIDEPELNLHVEWQQLLIKTIKKITDKRNEIDPYYGNRRINYIISTHSPYIINYSGVNVGGPEYEVE